MVIETSRPIARVAKELGINEGTLGNWVGIYRNTTDLSRTDSHEAVTWLFVGLRD